MLIIRTVEYVLQNTVSSEDSYRSALKYYTVF